jgi:hypothetical protein
VSVLCVIPACKQCMAACAGGCLPDNLRWCTSGDASANRVTQHSGERGTVGHGSWSGASTAALPRCSLSHTGTLRQAAAGTAVGGLVE